jgi:hypothetical protein
MEESASGKVRVGEEVSSDLENEMARAVEEHEGEQQYGLRGVGRGPRTLTVQLASGRQRR